MKLTIETARKLLVLLAEKFNHYQEQGEFKLPKKQGDFKLPKWYNEPIDITLIEKGFKKPDNLATRLWYVLHPAGYSAELNQDLWKGIKKDPGGLALEKKFEENGFNDSCNKDVIDRIIEKAYTRTTYSPGNEAISRICEYLELSEIDLKKNLEGKETPMILKTFCDTRWYGYYRTGGTGKKIAIAKCKIKIDSLGNVELKSPRDLKLTYTGSINIVDKQYFDLIIQSNESSSKNYMKFRIHKNSADKKKRILHGLYLKYAFGAPCGGSMILESINDEEWEEMEAKIVDLTYTEENKNMPLLPYSNKYDNMERKIQRALFERKYNFISTSTLDLSTKTGFKTQLLNWDNKWSSKKRPIYDIYISNPMGAYRQQDSDKDNFVKMQKDVNEIKELLSLYLNPSFYDFDEENELVAITPFDKMGKFRSLEEDKRLEDAGTPNMLNPYVNALEIKNSLLYVLYYPKTNVPSSCVIEAGWALEAGIPSLFIVDDKKGLVRYLKEGKFSKEACVSIIDNGIEEFRDVMKNEQRRDVLGNHLGAGIEFKADSEIKRTIKA